jgi:hypothetical protein
MDYWRGLLKDFQKETEMDFPMGCLRAHWKGFWRESQRGLPMEFEMD